MKALFLAGGISKRIWPVKIDKNLIEFVNQPLIAHTLNLAKNAGISEFIIVGNEANLEKLAGIAKRLKIGAKVILQRKPGQAGAILSAAAELANGEVLIVNANDVFEPSLYSKILKNGKVGKNEVVLTGFETKNYFPGGYLKVKHEQVLTIVEKPPPDKVPSNLVRLVVDYFKNPSQLIQSLESVKTDKDDLYEVAIDSMIKNGVKVGFTTYAGYWQSVKYPWHILDLTAYFLSKIKRKISKKASIAKKAIIDGEVIAEDGVKVFENSVIRGPCYLGRNTIVANGSLVRESIIGENCVVGYNTEITRSWIGANCWFHTNYVGDSVLDENVSLGSGAVTANLRLDEGKIYSKLGSGKISTQRNKFGNVIGKNVRIGVNASLMPGVKIGADSFIGAGVILSEDLEEEKFLVAKQQQTVKKNLVKTPTVVERKEFRQDLKRKKI